MIPILNQINRAINQAKRKINKLAAPTKVLTFGYLVSVILVVVTYYIVWMIMWLAGKENLPSLLALLKEMTGPAVVAFVGFIGSSFIDSDGDGIPDSFDKHDDSRKDKC